MYSCGLRKRLRAFFAQREQCERWEASPRSAKTVDDLKSKGSSCSTMTMHPTAGRRKNKKLGLGAKLIVTSALAFAFSLTLATEAEAAPKASSKLTGSGGNFGIGLSLGEPTGISAKWFFKQEHALQMSLGWGPFHHNSGRTHVDYLWHPGAFVSNSTLELLPYLGVGAGFLGWGGGGWHGVSSHGKGHHYWGHGHGHIAAFFRLPVLGLTIHWQKVPLDTFVEGAWAPMIIGHHGGRPGARRFLDRLSLVLLAHEAVGGAHQLIDDAGLVRGVTGIGDHLELGLGPATV